MPLSKGAQQRYERWLAAEQGALDANTRGLQGLSSWYQGIGSKLFEKEQGLADLGSVQGLDPQTKAALYTQAMQGIPGQFDSATAQLKMALARRGFGGNAPGGGNFAAGLGSLMAAREGLKSSALNQLSLQDYAAKLNNRNFLAGLYDPSKYFQEAEQYSGLANQSVKMGQENIQGFGNPLMLQKNQGFGGMLASAGIGAGLNLATGGLSNLASGGGFFGGGGTKLSSFAPSGPYGDINPAAGLPKGF